MNDVYHKLTEFRLSFQAVVLKKSLHPRRNGRLLDLANSDAIQSLAYKSSTTTRLASTRSYDTSDRLDGVTNTYGSSQTQTFGVSEFDDMNRRKKITREDGTRWNYGYNDKGEVTSGIREKTASPNTSVPGWNHGYTFDEIGNRVTSTTNSRTSTYSPNNLNQIASRTIPRAFDVIGKANAAFTVYINGNAAPRLDEYFYKEVSTTNNSSIHIPYIVDLTDGSAVTRRSGGKFLPATPETFTYDFDGNMTGDGRFTLTWDAENRLIGMQTLPTVPLAARRKLTFAYDSMGRRIRKTVWHGTSSGGWQMHHMFDFIHELGGWNILAERSGDSKDSFLRTYTWGTDLSGNLSAAGGVGGLLFTKFHTSNTTVANGTDLNGNVTLLINTATGQADATYDYGPFGEPLRQSGEYAILNPFRFSTKYTDDETGFVDYGLRYYNPMIGRWLSRDPIQEQGGLNLYEVVCNDPVDHVDVAGKYIFSRAQQAAGFNDAVKAAFEKLTGAELKWRALAGDSDDQVLCATKVGSGELWEVLKEGISSKTKKIRMIYLPNKATGHPERITIDHNISIKQWVLSGNADVAAFYDKPPKIELADTKFEEALWHEFAGHTMSPEPVAAQHPLGAGNEWNYYSEGEKDPKTRNAQWGKKFDYAIIQENKARKVLNKPMKAPWYYGLPTREGID